LKRVIVFIDAQNLLVSCIRQNPPIQYDMKKLVDLLVNCESGRELAEVFVYSAIPPSVAGDVADQERYDKQVRFFDKLRKDFGYQVFTKKTTRRLQRCKACGSTWVRDENKGIDVALATDLLLYGMTDQYDIAIIVSGHSDFATVIERIRRMKPVLKFEVAQFSSTLSDELASVASKVHRLDQHAERISM
jgi:uncharacterized LabA/DUF88 family protein